MGRELCRQIFWFAQKGHPVPFLPFQPNLLKRCRQPFVWMAIWTLCAGPPDLDVGLGLDDSAAKVSILRMVELALQKRAEEADVGACLIVGGKSCGGEQSEIRQAALYWKMYAKA